VKRTYKSSRPGTVSRPWFAKVRMNARHATTLLRALLVLTNAEISR
jgi:hypothetical protein